jgi:hypothetical protein
MKMLLGFGKNSQGIQKDYENGLCALVFKRKVKMSFGKVEKVEK